MTEKVLILEEERVANIMQRAIFERESLCRIIVRLFANHKDDENCDLFDSEQYKQYYDRLRTSVIQTNMLNGLYEEERLKPFLKEYKHKDINHFSWKLDYINSTVTIEYEDIKCEEDDNESCNK